MRGAPHAIRVQQPAANHGRNGLQESCTEPTLENSRGTFAQITTLRPKWSGRTELPAFRLFRVAAYPRPEPLPQHNATQHHLQADAPLPPSGRWRSLRCGFACPRTSRDPSSTRADLAGVGHPSVPERAGNRGHSRSVAVTPVACLSMARADHRRAGNDLLSNMSRRHSRRRAACHIRATRHGDQE
jgi:hypothetical protein